MLNLFQHLYLNEALNPAVAGQGDAVTELSLQYDTGELEEASHLKLKS